MKILIIQTMGSLSEIANNQIADLYKTLLHIIVVGLIFLLFFLFIKYYNNSKIDYYKISYSKPNDYQVFFVKAKSYDIEEIINGNFSNYTVYKIETLNNERLIIPEEKIFEVQIVYKKNLLEKLEKRNKAPHIIK